MKGVTAKISSSGIFVVNRIRSGHKGVRKKGGRGGDLETKKGEDHLKKTITITYTLTADISRRGRKGGGGRI